MTNTSPGLGRRSSAIREVIPVPDSLGKEAKFIGVCTRRGHLKCNRVLISAPGFGDDTGYPHDGRADKYSYPQDGRADKDSYPHDGRADKDSYPHDRHNLYIMLSLYFW